MKNKVGSNTENLSGKPCNDGAIQKVLDNRLHFPFFAVYNHLAILEQLHDVSVSH